MSPDPHLYPSQSKDLLNSYSAYFPGHWSSCDQSNSLTATRSLLVAGNGQRHQKVCERVPGMCHGKDTPPLTIWKVPSSPHSSVSMVTPRSRLFFTDLPASDGNTCILVTVDRLSKACRLVPLKGLPTAMETAEVLFNHVFRNFGIPKDIVSDRGSLFISQVWRSFFSLLGETVSLSSGYHPQSNGQIERKIQEIGATSVPSATATRTPGTDSSPGPSFHRTLSISPLRISPHSSPYSATSHFFSPGLRNLRRYHQSLIGSRRVRGCGTQHINISSVQYDITNIMRMSREPPLPPSTHNRRNGSPPGISD